MTARAIIPASHFAWELLDLVKQRFNLREESLLMQTSETPYGQLFNESCIPVDNPGLLCGATGTGERVTETNTLGEYILTASQSSEECVPGLRVDQVGRSYT